MGNKGSWILNPEDDSFYTPKKGEVDYVFVIMEHIRNLNRLSTLFMPNVNASSIEAAYIDGVEQLYAMVRGLDNGELEEKLIILEKGRRIQIEAQLKNVQANYANRTLKNHYRERFMIIMDYLIKNGVVVEQAGITDE